MSKQMHTLIIGDDTFEVVDAYARSMLSSPVDALMIKKSASGSIVSFADGADGVHIKAGTVTFDPTQAGSGDPSPSNIRTIIGHTGDRISVTAKNIFDEENADWLSGYYIDASGNVSSNSSYKCSQMFSKVKAETQYTVQFNKQSSSSLACTVAAYDENKNFISRQSAISATSATGAVSGSFTTPAGTAFIRINVPKTGTTNVMIEEGGTASASEYEAFGYKVFIEWESKAGTVYGGTLDLVNSTLISEYDSGDLGSLPFTIINGAFRLNMANRKTGNDVTPMCSAYKYDGTINSAEAIYAMTDKTFVFYEDGNTIFFKDTSYASVSAFQEAMAGQKLIWQLENPVTYQLDPVLVNTLLGLNNIWSDIGDLDLVYVADTKTYIDNNGGSDLPSASGVNF